MYSQYKEEEAILATFPDKTDGRFLDIGCWDPITFSNTRALVERGWSGVMIEPAPGPFLELLRCCTKCGVGIDEREHERYGERKQRECAKCGGLRYGFNPRFTLIQAAVNMEPGFLRICATDDALSTSNEESRLKWDKVGGFYGYILTPAITLEQIGAQFGGFDFINFDVEGYSAELCLKALNLGWQPTCICVEADGREAELIAAATPRHYSVVYGNGQNLVMVRR
jgi:hypothetical protein